MIILITHPVSISLPNIKNKSRTVDKECHLSLYYKYKLEMHSYLYWLLQNVTNIKLLDIKRLRKLDKKWNRLTVMYLNCERAQVNFIIGTKDMIFHWALAIKYIKARFHKRAFDGNLFCKVNWKNAYCDERKTAFKLFFKCKCSFTLSILQSELAATAQHRYTITYLLKASHHNIML